MYNLYIALIMGALLAVALAIAEQIITAMGG